jgi:hypothetical protein
MTLTFPRPEAFVQSLRQRRRALPPESVLLVVEGASDKRLLFPFIVSTAVVIPSRGRDNLIYAFDHLERALRGGVVFLLDCDDAVQERLKGHADLIITANRDIESDMLFELNALSRVAYEYLADRVSQPREVIEMSDDLRDSAAAMAAMLGVVRKAASTFDLPVRVSDARSGKRRSIRLTDLVSVTRTHDSIEPMQILSEMASDVADVIGWSSDNLDKVRLKAEKIYLAACGRHGFSNCASCNRMSLCNGHDVVDALAVILKMKHEVVVRPQVLARSLRVAADMTRMPEWSVAKRIRRWEKNTGVRLLDVVIATSEVPEDV